MTRLRLIPLLAFLGLLLCGNHLIRAEELPEILPEISLIQAETVPPGAIANQPPAPPMPPQQTSPFASNMASRSFSSGLRRPAPQMYDAPNMFGDLFSPAGTVTFQSTTQLLLIDPTASATLDPAVLSGVEQQLSQDATMQAQQQVIAQQNNPQMEGFVDPSLISINVALPDLTNAIVPPAPQVVFINLQGMADLQLAGGTRRTKISENNHSLPMDRVYFLYNHFHNAIATDQFLLPTTDANGFATSTDVLARRNVQSLNRYTLGFEKTFEEGQSSAEFRLPLIGDLQNGPGLGVQSLGGNVGNFSVILKRLFYTTDNFAVAAGLGINLPTGSDARGSIGNVKWQVNNEAVHYLPFLGIAGAPSDLWFYQAFAQLDLAGSGNPVNLSNSLGGAQVGKLTDQTLLFLDATSGIWLYKNPVSRLAGIASIVELHYTNTLQNADDFGVMDSSQQSLLFFGQPANRRDILNGTVGLHTVLRSGTSIRVGGVFPLRQSDDNRLFDAEVQAAINIPF